MIRVKAVERKLKFEAGENGAFQYRYVMQAELYSKLAQSKVIEEASTRSNISKGVMNVAWDAIGQVIKAWATEGHSVAIPGLGTMRFGLRSTAVEDVNKVDTNLIISRRVIFTPNTDIKDALKKTSISIICYDRNGDIVKRVMSSDNADVEDPEQDDAENGTVEPGNGEGQENGGGENGGGDNGGDNGGGEGSDMD